MARERGGPLLAQLARLARLLELSCDLEEDCSRVARGFESCRQRCCRLGLDLRRAREQLLAAESECSALRVKLQHARNQVEVEMGKRHRAEAELEKQERKLQLIFDFLMQESPSVALSEGQRSALALLDGPRLGTVLAPGSRLSAVDESHTSLTSHSDISYDRTEDDVDLDVTVVKPLKRKSQERPRLSLAPLIGPVVPAKRSRTPHPATSASEPPGTLPAGAVAEDRGQDRSLLPAAVVPVLGRRSRQGRRLSTLTELTTVWGSSEDSDTRLESGAGLEPRGLDPFPSPPQGVPPPQHLFTSKTVICPESCSVCGSRARFGRAVLRCRWCRLLLHPECRGRCPSLCTPGPRPQPREGVLADFAPPVAPLVPALVVQCVSEVERRGLTETGLYRVPGAEPLVREWKQKLLRAKGVLPSLGRVGDVHVVCGVLKDFLRGLKEPLVTFRLHPLFLRAADIPDEAACQAALCHVVSKLPPANRDTLAFLVLHLLRVAQSPDCRMDELNLARVFGPTLVGHGTSSPTPLAILEDTPQQCKVMARLLSLPPEFWRRFVGMELENLVPTAASDPLALNKQGRCWAPGRRAGSSPPCCRPWTAPPMAPRGREWAARGQGQRLSLGWDLGGRRQHSLHGCWREYAAKMWVPAPGQGLGWAELGVWLPHACCPGEQHDEGGARVSQLSQGWVRSTEHMELGADSY
ncbi:rac GTPase-activating protein 1-like isoform X2 [Gopherus evgoodei]|uniref:rac GTPase-activating protein 1-like isoform X2 n=1 Tax=Gopherus evgoodei TaxID=1825980 RepID=UPI0011CF8652|nr:rac GTPase-activating protein 1-like isoform X2 [Gopherus evgoodei]